MCVFLHHLFDVQPTERWIFEPRLDKIVVSLDFSPDVPMHPFRNSFGTEDKVVSL